MKNLELISNKLLEIKQKFKKYQFHYTVPGIWNLNLGEMRVDPFSYFSDQIKLIMENNFNDDSDIAYNLFIRYATTWEHNFSTNAKKFNLPEFKNEGTFLKSISLIPYLKSLGVNKIHLLPITSIGIDEKKGTLGSPFAVKNHYKIDENLSEPILGLDIETQYLAFIEACHHVGIKVIQEFIFRTVSIDADVAQEHPEWFYWIKAKTKIKATNDESGYSAPVFSDRKLNKIKNDIDNYKFKGLISPDDKFINQFTNTPKSVARVGTKIIGLLDILKKQKSNEVKIAPAFSDWPPDDKQPAWTDVTYFKLYDNPKFNYISYNTVRMYDDNLAQENNEQIELWNYIQNILPYWIDKFDIDGAMVDMGHALPDKLMDGIIKSAREKKKDFIFWEENFKIEARSKEKGYDAALGYLIFEFSNAAKYRELIHKINTNNYPIDILLSPENHNTNRLINFSNNKNFLISHFLLGKILQGQNYIHNGFELCESQPINLGLGFNEEELKNFPFNKLPLFSTNKLNWLTDNIIDDIKSINNIFKSISIKNNIEILNNELDEIIHLKINNSTSLLANFSNNDLEFNINLNEFIFGKDNYINNKINAFSTIIYY